MSVGALSPMYVVKLKTEFPIPPIVSMRPDAPGVKYSGPVSPTRYVLPAVTGPPDARPNMPPRNPRMPPPPLLPALKIN